MFDMVPFRRNNGLSKRGDDFEKLFDNFFNDSFFAPMNISGFGKGFKVDLKETENNYQIEADLPGINKEAIEINYDDNYLTISAKRDNSVEDKQDNYVRRERTYGEFKRSFYVDNVDKNNINAEFKNGVLKVILPKLEKGKETKTKIDIH
ncbi:Hsp20/alpha crystallin family protein [Clostridium fermenticellae]|uniref:Hsp20/alpha crystallin family protein n=1 Tax=Clostridium fermenticellae TaxID=2068654 RepID=A0A386H6Q4_9CLOT|nr:heat shock protein Hsp18 [Clostridium fermenticellae]AYD41356.1 Hsp20/alpha crystallin family protein [Clostridium fermenticellae]